MTIPLNLTAWKNLLKNKCPKCSASLFQNNALWECDRCTFKIGIQLNKIYQGDSLEVLKTFPDESVDCVITSPPYWNLRDYSEEKQLGREATFGEYLDKLLKITAELKRVLKPTGTLWWNHGDSYGTGSGAGKREGKQATVRGSSDFYEEIGKSSVKGYEKSLLMLPDRLALRMIDEQGWKLRNKIVWQKPNAMPDSAEDRFTNDWEPVFFFVKSKSYYFEQQLEKSIWAELDKRAITGPSSGGKATSGNYSINKVGAFRDDGMRNRREVWRINTKPFADAHFATFPRELIAPMIKAGCPVGGVVLDPFMGSGTVAEVSKLLGRNYLGIDLNADYIKLANERVSQKVLI